MYSLKEALTVVDGSPAMDIDLFQEILARGTLKVILLGQRKGEQLQ